MSLNRIITRGYGKWHLINTLGYGNAQVSVTVTPSVLTLFIDILEVFWEVYVKGQGLIFYSEMSTGVRYNTVLADSIELYSKITSGFETRSPLGSSIEIFSSMSENPGQILFRV